MIMIYPLCLLNTKFNIFIELIFVEKTFSEFKLKTTTTLFLNVSWIHKITTAYKIKTNTLKLKL